MKKNYILFLLVVATSFTWQTKAQNGGDNCANAVLITPAIYSDVAITVGTGGASQDSATDAMWYSYIATGNGTININSCASDPAGIDTRLWIYTDTCNTLTPIANDDDGCDAPTTYGSILEDVVVNIGQEYLFEWDDRWGADALQSCSLTL